MGFIRDEMDKEANNFIGYANKQKLVRRLPQTAKSKVNLTIDASRKALPSGKRISRTGKVYWETRKNRTDQFNSKT